jgi:hypothetical protein
MTPENMIINQTILKIGAFTSCEYRAPDKIRPEAGSNSEYVGVSPGLDYDFPLIGSDVTVKLSLDADAA